MAEFPLNKKKPAISGGLVILKVKVESVRLSERLACGRVPRAGSNA